MISQDTSVQTLQDKLVALNNEYHTLIERQKVIGQETEEHEKALIDLKGEYRRIKLDVKRSEKEMQNTKKLLDGEKYG